VRDHHDEEVAFDLADVELTRREALKRLGLLGLSTTGAVGLGAVFAGDATALAHASTGAARASAPGVASRGAPNPPPDIVSGQGAWRMMDWGNAYEAFVDVPLWKSRGWGGFSVGIDRPNQDFTPSSQLGNQNPIYEMQRYIESKPGASLPERCHAKGCESYIGMSFSDSDLRDSGLPPWGDWFNETVRADVAAKFGRLAAFGNWIGIDGLGADCELGLWDRTNYDGNSHTTEETRDQAYSWGRAIGTAIFKAHPASKMLVYYWNPPGGWEDTFVYGQTSADTPLTHFWMGYLEAMAAHGNTDSRMVVIDAFFYKPTPQVAGASLANALKYHTQGSMAWLSQHVAPAVWNKVCDRIDISLFSWAGTDSHDDGFYQHTGEPAFADQLSLFHRYAMGTRRANFTLEGSPDRYCWTDHTHQAPENRDREFDQANNWYVVKTTSGPNDAPGGHLPGLRAAARREPVNTTPPVLTASSVDHGDGRFTVTGSAYHIDGIRCIRGYVHPKKTARVAAKMTLNVRAGNYQTNYDTATQDYTITVDGKPGQYFMVTAVSIHDQEHSMRVKL
jgi:hypothetical protein